MTTSEVMAPVVPATLTLVLLVAIVYTYKWFFASATQRPLPPGPKGVPIFGNVSDMPKPGMLECHHWLKHKALYGPISSVTVLGQTIVIINDPKIASELMRGRSAIHSSRPHQVFSCDLVGWKNATAMSPYADSWRLHRKNITKIVSSNVAVSAFDRIQEVEAAHFLLNVLRTPDDLFDHIRQEAGTAILQVAYGYQTEAEGKDPLVDLAGRTMENFAAATVPGKFAVDMLPFLRYLPEWCPGTGFKQTAKKWAAELDQCASQPYAFTKHQMKQKKHRTSFLSQAIETSGSDPYMEHINKWAALSLYLGGADTTVSSFMTFFLAMTVFPEVQKRAQEELERVVGRDRLPLNSDLPKLPYIEAIMKETHRWHNVVPMGLPHCSTQEDVYQGYRIPKGALLLYNTWHFTHDPEVYPEPDVFRPERFLTTPKHTTEPDPRDFIFGFGRRICPGRHVADNSLLITIAQTLAVFNIEKPVDSNGKIIEPQVAFEAGTISHPLPFKTSIKPRSDHHEKLIRSVEELFPWEESDAKELENIPW